MQGKESFVKWLTNRDVEKIAKLVGLKLMEKDEDDNKQRIIRYKKEDGYHLIAFCNYLPSEEIDQENQDFMMKVPEYKQLCKSFLLAAGIFASLGGDYYGQNNTVVLDFDDFFLQEAFSLKEKDEQIEYNRNLTKVYQQYMSEKFGRHYNDMKRACYQKLYKEIRNEGNEQQEQQLWLA